MMCLNQKSPLLERMKEERRAQFQPPGYPESMLIPLPTQSSENTMNVQNNTPVENADAEPRTVAVPVPDEDDEEWCEKHQHGTFRGRCASCRDEWQRDNQR